MRSDSKIVRGAQLFVLLVCISGRAGSLPTVHVAAYVERVHMPNSDGSGMGSRMGYGMSVTTRTGMQQQMQEHMGSGFHI